MHRNGSRTKITGDRNRKDLQTDKSGASTGQKRKRTSTDNYYYDSKKKKQQTAGYERFHDEVNDKNRKKVNKKKQHNINTGINRVMEINKKIVSLQEKSSKKYRKTKVEPHVNTHFANKAKSDLNLNVKSVNKSNKCYNLNMTGGKKSQKKSNPTFQDKKRKNKLCSYSCAKQPEAKECKTEDDEIEIPGFYYDRERKKYFKILPGHSNIFNAITNETIERNKVEEKRLRDLELFHRGLGNKKSVTVPNVVPNIFKLFQGNCKRSSFEASLARTKILNLKPLASIKISSDPFTSYENLEHMLLMDVASDYDKLIGMWSVQSSMVHRIQLLTIKEKPRCGEFQPLSVNINFQEAAVIQTWNKVTHICWAPFEIDEMSEQILYTTMCYTGDANSLALIRNLDPGAESPRRFIDFNLGKKATWTCAWNRRSKQFSVGSEKAALLLDVQTRRMWEFFTYHSDPLSQIFSLQTGQSLHSGTRRGQILTHDLRSISTRPMSCLNHKTSICSLKLLQDDMSLISSDFSGKASLWDLRMRRVVLDYRGGFNEYSRIPIHVDEHERIVYGAGQDGYTRFWCLKTGELLNTIPPPCATTRETIPAVQYSQRWGDRNGNAGLLLGLQDKLHMYSSPVLNEYRQSL